MSFAADLQPKRTHVPRWIGRSLLTVRPLGAGTSDANSQARRSRGQSCESLSPGYPQKSVHSACRAVQDCGHDRPSRSPSPLRRLRHCRSFRPAASRGRRRRASSSDAAWPRPRRDSRVQPRTRRGDEQRAAPPRPLGQPLRTRPGRAASAAGLGRAAGPARVPHNRRTPKFERYWMWGRLALFGAGVDGAVELVFLQFAFDVGT